MGVKSAMGAMTSEHDNVPPFLLEVAYHNESFSVLLDEDRLWLHHPSAQMVMLVKIEPEPDAAPQVFVTFAFKAGNQITFLLPVNIGAGSHCLAAGW